MGRGEGIALVWRANHNHFLGRTVCALFWPPPPIVLEEGETNGGREMGQFVYGDRGGCRMKMRVGGGRDVAQRRSRRGL